MLSFFPTPYLDETLYSLLARYHVRSGNLSPKWTLRDLFGSTTVIATADLPSHLSFLVQNLPPLAKHTVDSLIYQHTLYPYYSPFLPTERAETIFHSMADHSWGDIHTSIGIMASTVALPTHLRFCASCLIADENRYGEYYWHRTHQLPGVFICPDHLVPLQNSQVDLHNAYRHQFYPANQETCKPTLLLLTLESDALKKLSLLAEDAKWLLTNRVLPKDTAWFREQYGSLLIEQKLANPNGRVKQCDLIQRLRNHYGSQVLTLLDSEIVTEQGHNWLSSIVRKHRKAFHPLRHLLLIHFLGHTASSFFNLNLGSNPFGNGPWTCFNAAANHYLQSVITEISIAWSQDMKKLVGTFSCDCGFVYSTSDREVATGTDSKLGRIKAFGKAWENELENLAVSKNLGLREIARRLKVDPLTVKRHSTRLAINRDWKTSALDEKRKNIASEKSKMHEQTRKRHRQIWLGLQQTFNDSAKTALRGQAPATFAWLYRHDKKWLDGHSPDLQQAKPSPGRVDWGLRDTEILQLVKHAIQEILRHDPPMKVSLSRIARFIGRLSLLEQHLDKMPLTEGYLQSNIESQTQFQIRRVKWAVKKLRSSGNPVVMWRVIKMAGLRKEYSSQLMEFIADEIHQADENDVKLKTG